MSVATALEAIWSNKLAQFGRCLETGVRVMSGSFTRQYGLATRLVPRADRHVSGKVASGYDEALREGLPAPHTR